MKVWHIYCCRKKELINIQGIPNTPYGGQFNETSFKIGCVYEEAFR